MIRRISSGSRLALIAAGLSLIASRPVQGQEKAPSAFGAALAVTRSTGAATVVIFSSRHDPASLRFREEFDRGAWARHNRGLVQVANVTVEDEPGLTRSLGISRTPAARVYGKTERGVALLASIPDCTTPEALASRLSALQVGLEPPGKSDGEVLQASGQVGVQASQQSLPPPSPSWPQSPPTGGVAPPALAASPTFATTTANIVQVPSQNLLIQQSAPQIFVAPTPAPTVYVAQQAGATTAAVATAPAGNLFLSSPTTATVAAPVAIPMPTTATAQSPVQAFPQAQAAPSVTGTTVGAMTNQSMSVPSSGVRTRVRVRGPGLLASGLARIGERMADLGRTRVEIIQETTLEPPATQPAQNGTTTISTITAAPITPLSTLALPLQQPVAPQAPLLPSSPTATPQGGTRIPHP